MKTRKSYRKLIAILLSIVTIIGCFSVTAFADEVETPPEEPVVIDSIVQVPSHETNFGVGGPAIAKTNIPVYYDITLSGSYQIGTIFYGEGFTVIANDGNVAPYYCLKVEYNTINGPQQGYIEYSPSLLQASPNIVTHLAHVNVSSAPVYYGAEPFYYQSFGTVYYGEFVAVIGLSPGYNYDKALIEYNAANGKRKRGYVDSSALYFFNNPSYLTPFDYAGTDQMEINIKDVYSGPSEEYPIIGQIGPNEPVCMYPINVSSYYYDNSYWKYITYQVNNTNYYKAGYIKIT